MSEALAITATRPSTRDEEWRYADADYLASADPARLTQWLEHAVAPGETERGFAVIEADSKSAGFVDRLRVHVGKGGRYEHFVINAGGPYARCELDVTLEEGAHFELGGVTLGGGEVRQEIVTRVIHAAPQCTSNQVVRAVQWGRSTGNFLGRVEIPKDSQKVEAAQNFRAILLEAGASANAKPELEIFADDVKAAHGAAIGALDEQAGFYMASRGIAPEAARKLLVRAFIADAFVAISDDELREDMLDQALHFLEGVEL
ncbi:MAG: SufD family Fe-S cluster assembly protein [Sphingomonadaceae bacterium]|nr:SufD family Fe-S cluster assembly protein [Sphingomonadaceae bacterium]